MGIVLSYCFVIDIYNIEPLFGLSPRESSNADTEADSAIGLLSLSAFKTFLSASEYLRLFFFKHTRDFKRAYRGPPSLLCLSEKARRSDH